jgi:hypothetical protein
MTCANQSCAVQERLSGGDAERPDPDAPLLESFEQRVPTHSGLLFWRCPENAPGLWRWSDRSGRCEVPARPAGGPPRNRPGGRRRRCQQAGSPRSSAFPPWRPHAPLRIAQMTLGDVASRWGRLAERRQWRRAAEGHIVQNRKILRDRAAGRRIKVLDLGDPAGGPRSILS